jgi:uncharacterized protein (TIGR04222 family)
MKRFGATIALTLGVLLATAAPALADDIGRFDVVIDVAPDGSMTVTETIDYTFEGTDHHGIYRDIPTRTRYDDTYDRVLPIDVVSVSASGASDDVEVSQEPGGITRIRIGDPDEIVSGSHTYTIVYSVEGAMNGFADHDELYWNATGDDWTARIAEASATVRMPGPIARVACFQGWDRSVERCGRATIRDDVARFAADRPLFPGEGLTFVVGVDPGVVAQPAPILTERWSAERAFGLSPASGAAVAGVAIVFGLLMGGAMWRTGRDRRFRGSPVDQVMGGSEGEERVPVGDADTEAPVEFAPPDDIRPGQVGTLIDERANVVDVTATIVDLAVRGFLHIQEIPKEGWFGKPDWQLTKLPRPGAPLLAYETELLEGLFRDGDEVLVSELRERFADRLHEVQRALYDDAMRRRWFRGDPDSVRSRWTLIGAATLAGGVALTYVLARYTHLGLAGIAVIVGGVATLILASRMPARTAEGTAMVRRVRGFRRVIETAETHMSRWAEEENVFTRFLPYAVVFGLTEKWAKAFAQLGIEPDTTSWYAGQHAFTGAAFADAIDGFAVTTGGTLASTPASSGSSGFGGGGFSGGGGGGGGGGSW